MSEHEVRALRGAYDAFVARAGAHLWMYQSCESHGCGTGCVETTDPYFTGWPSYMNLRKSVTPKCSDPLFFGSVFIS